MFAAHHRLHERRGGGRLVVPLDERADVGAVVARRVNPVDPRAALLGSHRAGRAEHEHRRAVAPGVEDAHHAVQQADVAVQDAGHRLAGRLGIAVRDRDRMIFVQAENDAGILVAEMVNQAVVKSAIARPWVEADKRNIKAAQHLRGDVAAPGNLVVGFSFNLDPTSLSFSLPLLSDWCICGCGHSAQVLPNRTSARRRRSISALPAGVETLRGRWYATMVPSDDHAALRTAVTIKETTFA